MAEKDTAELEQQLEFMRVKLSETREALVHQPIVIAYDNGGGQTGIRKNPAYDGYTQLMRTYTQTLREYSELTKGDAKRQPQLVKFQKFADSMRKVSAD